MAEQYIKNSISDDDQKILFEINKDLQNLVYFWMRKPWSKTLVNLNLLKTYLFMLIDSISSSDIEEKIFIYEHYRQKIIEMLDTKQSFKLKDNQITTFNNIKNNFELLFKL